MLSTLASGGAVRKQGRLLACIAHGSGKGGVSRSKGTPLNQLCKLISAEEDVIELSIAGVGTSGQVFDFIVAAFGFGLNKKGVMMYKAIAVNFVSETATRECTRILLAGFSRGVDILIKVAKLINAVGLVADGDDELYRKLYELLETEGPWDKETIKNVKHGYNWIEDVKIAELLAFDCVSTHGVPPTGIGRVLKALPGWSKNNDHMIQIPPNVEHISHVAMLQDPRAAYEHSTLCILESSNQVLRQSYFNGRHSDAMNTGSMAFQLQNLKADMNLKFNQDRLDASFPGPSAGPNIIPDWVFGNIKPVNAKFLAILGNKPRIPGRYSRPGMVTNEEIHSSVRHRGYGRTRDDRAVDVFHPGSDPITGRHSWMQSSSNRMRTASGSGSEELDVPLRLPEAKVGDLESFLSGLPAN